jgi:predicted Fe-Mo cluster-binding NifX family protein
MKIAIPVFQTKISPRLDSTQNFILLKVEYSRVLKRNKLNTTGWSLSAKLKRLVDLEVDTLICGGIDLESMQHLNFNGIKVYSWITGEVEDAVTRFLNQGLESGIILGTHGSKKGQWRFCAMRNHFCNAAQPSFNSNREEVNNMPKGDGSGPKGQGSGAGKGRRCTGAGKSGKRSGQAKGCGGGQGRAKGAGSGRQGR